ncbi:MULTISPECIES: MgtC/SapB family protein [unclassified Beijerinckia]|uniref:MgtC/SapB family protein n=1 Tax=unclassified Beijerinckia TaxID=2638183 RepID=UPI001FCD1765|nr:MULTISPECIES: MgtC/SapB family protein [unclassified Beijerinckia]MDH7798856.1 putative Mg2+ transporter-C (MgtC) family protein [Beijerinckia sp. GAS462]
MQNVWTNIGAVSIAPNLVLALLFGALVGVERQWRQRHTGLSTHALVSLGAAAFTSLAVLVQDSAEARMGGQVVTGIGFLGAGLIMRDGLSVRGLSGAATIWATGAVGTLAGYGFLLEAAEVTAFVLFANIAFPKLSWIIDHLAPEGDQTERFYTIALRCTDRNEATARTMLIQALNAQSLRLRGLESNTLKDSESVEVRALVHSVQDEDRVIERLVSELSLFPSISSASWTFTTSSE